MVLVSWSRIDKQKKFFSASAAIDNVDIVPNPYDDAVVVSRIVSHSLTVPAFPEIGINLSKLSKKSTNKSQT